MTNARQSVEPAEIAPFAARHIGPNEAEIAADARRARLRVARRADRRHRARADPAPPAARRSARPRDRARGARASCARSPRRTRSSARTSGMGYSDTLTPPVIQRNILENPGWYTAYTPYQAEIAQGRLEALLNFQTMVIDLTGLEIANASLLDEGDRRGRGDGDVLRACSGKRRARRRSSSSDDCHPQTIDVVQTRAARARHRRRRRRLRKTSSSATTSSARWCSIRRPTARCTTTAQFCERAHAAGALVTVAADLLEPRAAHAAGRVGRRRRASATRSASACRSATAARTPRSSRRRTSSSASCPGRIIGVSRDADGKPALRMALQTREQHIRREKATSNVCTAQVLLAVIAGMYAVYHGPEGLTRIARARARLRRDARRRAASSSGYTLAHDDFFDTLRVELGEHGARATSSRAARERRINLRALGDDAVVHRARRDVDRRRRRRPARRLRGGEHAALDVDDARRRASTTRLRRALRAHDARSSRIRCSTRYHSETEMLRYMRGSSRRDLSLTTR